MTTRSQKLSRLVIASHNLGKINECKSVLDPHFYSIESAADLQLAEPEEPYPSFIENALVKARSVAQQLSQKFAQTNAPKATTSAENVANTWANNWVLADDSGLCVPALEHQPGVHSASFAKANLAEWAKLSRAERDTANNQALLARLSKIATSATPTTLANSPVRAYFYCVLVLLKHAEDPQPLIATGSWHGQILTQPTGQQGFGYDAVFYCNQYQKSAGLLTTEEKNRVSHRGQALQNLLQLISKETSLQNRLV
jgi:XTP/dITP diphosphohydrolase